MNKTLKSLMLILCVFSSLIFGVEPKEDLSLERIVSEIGENGIVSALNKIETSKSFEKSSRQITLSNKMEMLAVNRFETTKWTVSTLSEDKNEFSLRMPIGGYSFISPFFDPIKFKVFECDDNGATSGTRIISFYTNSLAVVESWSCGSRGCSYDFLFSKNTTETNQNFCL
jgi:hypothetical protein